MALCDPYDLPHTTKRSPKHNWKKSNALKDPNPATKTLYIQHPMLSSNESNQP